MQRIHSEEKSSVYRIQIQWVRVMYDKWILSGMAPCTVNESFLTRSSQNFLVESFFSSSTVETKYFSMKSFYRILVMFSNFEPRSYLCLEDLRSWFDREVEDFDLSSSRNKIGDIFEKILSFLNFFKNKFHDFTEQWTF